MLATIEDQLSVDQSRLTEGRSCASQVLNVTQYLEYGHETEKITRAVFIDRTAVYDTINHRALPLKAGLMIKNSKIFIL